MKNPAFFPILYLCLVTSVTLAEPAPGDVRDKLEPLLSEHCYDCHDDVTDKGGLNLLDLDFSPTEHANFEKWQRVFDRVESGEMPPKKKPRPEKSLQEDFLGSLKSPLLAADQNDVKEKGRVQVRRLTRTEYEHTLHDLLGIDIPLRQLLPADLSTHGFETVASGQQLSHFNLARYLEVADLALDEAFRRAGPKPKPFLKEHPAPMLGKAGHKGGNYRGPETRNGESLHWPMRLQFYGRMPVTRVRESGWYRVTLKNVRAINAQTGVAWGTLRSGACASNDPLLYTIGLVEATKEKRDLVYDAWLQEDHMLELKPNDSTRKVAPSGATGGNVAYTGRDLVKDGFEGIAISSIIMERIYPNGDQATVRRKLFGDLTKEELKKLISGTPDEMKPLMGRAIQQFANQAFRRPVATEDVEPYIDLAFSKFNAEKPTEVLATAYRAILCSPRFLTLIETPGRLDDHALAARMSYMLWNSMPDSELRKLADQGKITADYKVRHGQINRMLDDPKANRFIESFTDQWLNLKEIDFTVPDRRRFSTFDPIVRQSILAETRAFVKELIVKNKSITNLVQSDFTMLNERLQRFYKLDKVTVAPGKGLQRVSLGEDQTMRGGLVTHGSVLKVTADGTITSPIVRGVWVGERILGLEIPPPPPGIPAIEPDIRGAVSIRDQLDKHRNDESCAACHLKIDPAGFALESFDPVGLWRTKYGTKKNSAVVDPTGITPEGDEFTNIKTWKKIYTERPDQLAHNFASQLLTYATGASPRFSDRQDIEKIVTSVRDKNYGLKSIVHGIVASQAFRQK